MRRSLTPSGGSTAAASMIRERRARARRLPAIARRNARARCQDRGGDDRRRAGSSSFGRRSSTSSSIRSGTCLRLATTSPKAAATRRIYDALASEARLASFIAIAMRHVSQEHWFKLGRLMTPVGPASRARVVERVDVRVPDAAARHAHLSAYAARRDVRSGHQPSHRVREGARACRGEFRSPPTTCRTRAPTTSTARSACRASD